jgi:muconolactone delta-isomerase
MNQYLVDLDLPDELTDEFLSLIPHQRAHINKMMADGVLNSYALSSDRTKVWAIIVAESEMEVDNVLQTMPLFDYMESTIYELAFYNVAGSGLPAISLN